MRPPLLFVVRRKPGASPWLLPKTCRCEESHRREPGADEPVAVRKGGCHRTCPFGGARFAGEVAKSWQFRHVAVGTVEGPRSDTAPPPLPSRGGRVRAPSHSGALVIRES